MKTNQKTEEFLGLQEMNETEKQAVSGGTPGTLFPDPIILCYWNIPPLDIVIDIFGPKFPKDLI
jgi:hypothetical protein